MATETYFARRKSLESSEKSQRQGDLESFYGFVLGVTIDENAKAKTKTKKERDEERESPIGIASDSGVGLEGNAQGRAARPRETPFWPGRRLGWKVEKKEGYYMDGHGKIRDPPCREERGCGAQRQSRDQLDGCEKRDEFVAPEDLEETDVRRDGKGSQKELVNMPQKCGTQGAQTVSEDAAPNVSVLLHEPDKLQAMVSEIWSMMKGNECFVDLLERENQALKGQMHDLKAEHLREVETLKSEIATQRKSLEDELEKSQFRSAAEIKRLREELEELQSIHQWKAEHLREVETLKSEIATQRKSLDDELEKSQFRSAAEIKRLREELEAQRQLHDTEMLQMQKVNSSLIHVNEHAMKQEEREAVCSESICRDAQNACNDQNLHANQPEQALQSADLNLSTKENRESNVASSNAFIRKAVNDAEDNDAENDFNSAASIDFLFEGSQRSANSVGPTQDEVMGTPQSRRSTKCSSGPPTQDEVCFSPHRAKRSSTSSPEDDHLANSPAGRSAPHLSNSADKSPQTRTNFARGSRCPSPCAPRTPRMGNRERKLSPSSRNSTRTPKWSDKPSSKVFSASKPAHRHKPNGRFFPGRSPSQKRRRLRERDQEEEEESLQTPLQKNKGTPLVSKNGAQETAAGGALAPGHKFRFVEVVRNKADRAALPGHSCHKCERFYAALRVTDPHALQELRNECSRHRHRYVAPGTPPTFWDIPSLNSFADTQTQDSGPS